MNLETFLGKLGIKLKANRLDAAGELLKSYPTAEMAPIENFVGFDGDLGEWLASLDETQIAGLSSRADCASEGDAAAWEELSMYAIVALLKEKGAPVNTSDEEIHENTQGVIACIGLEVLRRDGLIQFDRLRVTGEMKIDLTEKAKQATSCDNPSSLGCEK